MQISEHCYALTGLCDVPPWAANAGIVVGNTKTLVIDTGINLLSAQTIFGYASVIRPSNQIIVVNTERHLDHIGGNCFFHDKKIDIYGHHLLHRSEEALTSTQADFNLCITNPVRRQVAEANVFFTKSTVINPDHLIYQEEVFELGDLEVQILLTPGHTITNLSLYITSDNILFSSDCIVSGYLPNLEDGNIKDWQDWLISLDRLEALRPALVVPGHGQVISEQQIEPEINRMRSIIRSAIQSGKAPTTL